VGNTVLMKEHRLSEPGEHKTQIADDGKLPVRQNDATAQSYGCVQQGKIKDSQQIKTKSKPA
jgi:hypothetical protein